MTAMTFQLESGPAAGPCHLLLAHGAGAGITSPFLESLAELLAARGIHAVRFEFDYMAAWRTGGTRRPPPRAETLTGSYAATAAALRERIGKGARLFIGGKSLGGRVASLIANDAYLAGHISGCVCLGYPFHPPGKPEKLRTAHLAQITCPTLIVQGTRDPFGSQTEVENMRLAPAVGLHWIGDGDHDFGPRGASGYTRTGNLAAAADAVAAFVAGH